MDDPDNSVDDGSPCPWRGKRLGAYVLTQVGHLTCRVQQVLAPLADQRELDQ